MTNSMQIFLHSNVQSPSCKLIDWSSQSIEEISTSWKPLIYIDLKVSNPLKNIWQETSSHGTICSISRTNYCTEKPFSIRTIGKDIFTMLSQSYPPSNTFCVICSLEHYGVNKTPSMNPMTSLFIVYHIGELLHFSQEMEM
jgi:hypothetical protein